MNADDETNVTDIDLLADGRICVFGASEEVLQVLDALQGGQDPAIRRRLVRGENVSASGASDLRVQRGNDG
jgi:hypothetical protein